MSQITPITFNYLPKDILNEVLSHAPYTAIINLIMTQKSFGALGALEDGSLGLKDACFWEWRNQVHYPFTERDATKTAFEWFKYSQTIRNNMQNQSWKTTSFPCLTTMHRNDGGPSYVYLGEKYLAAKSHCSLLEWFDAVSYKKLGEFKLHTENSLAYHMIEHKDLLCINLSDCDFHGDYKNRIILFCPQTKKILLRSEPLAIWHLSPTIKAHNDNAYCVSHANSLRKFSLTNIGFVQEIELYERKDGENKSIPDFSFDKERNILYALIRSNVSNTPGQIAVYDLNIESTEPKIKLEPLFRIPIENVPIDSKCIMEKNCLFFFVFPLTAEGIAERWEIDFNEKEIRKIYSETNAFFGCDRQFIQEDYIYSMNSKGEVMVSDVHTGKPITHLAYLDRIFDLSASGSTSIKQIQPGKDCVAFLHGSTTANLIEGRYEHACKIEVLDFTKKRGQPLEILESSVQNAVAGFKEDIMPQIVKFSDDLGQAANKAAKFFEKTDDQCVVQ